MSITEHPSRLATAPMRRGMDTGWWVTILNDNEISLVLYNSGPDKPAHVVAIEKDNCAGAPDSKLPRLVYSMAAKIEEQVKRADTLQYTLKCEVRLVNLNTI